MPPLFLNDSCPPFGGPDGTCVLGDLASYAINITDATTVAKGIQFAREKNIRLTIKNTGHDNLGRSAGQGSLALWTHNLKEISFMNYSSSFYNGPAIRIGAGVQLAEVYKAAAKNGLRVVGGSCPTVGVAGGYTQGGGHGPLTGLYGLGADNSLEWDVVTADGQHLIASPTTNADLYWALSGGGPGNYAAVLSLTIRAHKDGPVAGSSLGFVNTNDETFWAAVSAWLNHLLVIDLIPGLNTFWGLTNESFTLIWATWPDKTAEDLSATLAPLVQELATLNLNLTVNDTRVDTNFYNAYEFFNGGQTYNTNYSVGGRLVSRNTVQNLLPELVDIFRNITNDEAYPNTLISMIGANVSNANGAGHNAVLPAWRDALFTMNFALGVPATDSRTVITRDEAQLNAWQDLMRSVTVGGGSYMNEATYDNTYWKEDYFGVNYDRLLAIKEKYDPEHVFWGNAAVGSDNYWELASDGRLCRIQN
jgi:FAD/FMN-containing dehydrogenase